MSGLGFPTGAANSADTGHYGRMFPPAATPVDLKGEDDLRLLGASMMDSSQKGLLGTVAGITYFGQFIDHDLTLDNTKLEERNVEPNQVKNGHAARLDLKLVYGEGPTGSPDLYIDDKLKIGSTGPIPGTQFPGGTLRDIGRTQDQQPLLGDPNDARNLENLLVMQIHVLFMNFHNAAVDQCDDKVFKDLPLEGNKFERAQQLVRWHYQWLVRNYFLVEVLEHEVQQDVCQKPKIKWAEDGFFIPAEFSLAAFRFGHSMVREDYFLNCHRGIVPLVDLMMECRKPGPLPEDSLVEWGRLFKGLLSSGSGAAPSSTINTAIVKPLHNLDDPTKRLHNPHSPTETQPHLPTRTLLRGARANLPTGQEVAENLVAKGLLKASDVLKGEKLTASVASTNDDSGKVVAASPVLQQQTPLYYYLLKEAEVLGSANRTLGPVGSRIVAEVIETVLRADPTSYINAIGLDWQLPQWRFRDGTRGAIYDVRRLVQMLGDALPQGCRATIRSRLVGFGARVVRQIAPLAHAIGFR
jgi:hypothetical protein